MEFSTLVEEFLKREKEIPNAIFLRQPFNGVWKTWTWSEAGNEIRRVANGLLSLNLPPKTSVAILSKNCAHWIMADLAIMMAGYVSVPIYPTLTAVSIKPILGHSDSKVIFVGKLDNFDSQKNGIPEDLIQISFDVYGINANYSWKNFVLQHEPIKEIYSWNSDEVFTIKYTSGTTGYPKGVMHSMGNIDIWEKEIIKMVKLPPNPNLFSYLPLSHIAERLAIECHSIYRGATISFAESLETFAKNLSDTQPDAFFGVPRIWAKFREKIQEKLPEKKLNFLLSIPVIKNSIKKKLRKKLGLSKATHIYTGASPISMEHLIWFDKIGIRICQIYGMTEDCGYNHIDLPEMLRYGTVGKPFGEAEVKISGEGEIRVKSKVLMKGYYKEAELTAATFDEEGFLKTGDIGEYDTDGYLRITGRIKDQFKTDKGKYISPAPIELSLLANPDIEQVCVVGTGIPQPIALACLSEAGQKKSKEELVQSLGDTKELVNQSLDKFEKLHRVVIMKENWTIENGKITPTLKVKRNEVEKIHLPSYPAWFQKAEIVLWEE
ncbi:MAG: AMP-binding protein [Sphingobacteriales bacterium]